MKNRIPTWQNANTGFLISKVKVTGVIKFRKAQRNSIFWVRICRFSSIQTFSLIRAEFRRGEARDLLVHYCLEYKPKFWSERVWWEARTPWVPPCIQPRRWYNYAAVVTNLFCGYYTCTRSWRTTSVIFAVNTDTIIQPTTEMTNYELIYNDAILTVTKSQNTSVAWSYAAYQTIANR